MTHPDYLRTRARMLRVEKRFTLDELVDCLALPRTTVYYWIRDLPLARPRSTAAQAKGTAAMQAKYRRLREQAYAQGWAEFDELVSVPTFRDFVVLYIAEGYKRNRNRVALGNSDPRLVAVTARWLAALSTKRLSYALQHHADQDPARLRSHWAQVLDIDGSVIRLQRKSNSGQLRGRIWRSEFGVLTVETGDTLLRARVQAWIDRVRGDWALDSMEAHGA